MHKKDDTSNAGAQNITTDKNKDSIKQEECQSVGASTINLGKVPNSLENSSTQPTQQPQQQPAQKQVNIDRNLIFRQHLDLKCDTLQNLAMYEIQEVSKQQVRLFIQDRNYARSTININWFGLKNLCQSFTQLNYLTCKIGVGRQCELCECTDPKLQMLYMIPGGSKIHFVHAVCVHNSEGFKINESGKIENYAEAIQKFKEQTCKLCDRPNASLECAGSSNNIRCENKFHVHCLFNSPLLVEAKGNQTIVCRKHKIVKPKGVQKQLNDSENQQLQSEKLADTLVRKIVKTNHQAVELDLVKLYGGTLGNLIA